MRRKRCKWGEWGKKRNGVGKREENKRKNISVRRKECKEKVVEETGQKGRGGRARIKHMTR